MPVALENVVADGQFDSPWTRGIRDTRCGPATALVQRDRKPASICRADFNGQVENHIAMNLLRSTLAAVLLLQAAAAGAADNWPTWRGPDHDGRVLNENPPVKWTADSLAWKTPVPGRGHSSPVIDRGRIFLTSADEEKKVQMVLAFDQATGKELWRRPAFTGGYDDERVHKRNTQASSTVACDGERVYSSFLNDHAIWNIAFDYDGNELWRQKTGNYKSWWGYSASPILYGKTLIVTGDHIDGGFVAALDTKTGQQVWSTPRPKSHNYTSPVVYRIGDKDQLVLAGCDQFSAYDPATGKELWNVPAATTLECVGTAVTSNGLVFASGGYPKKETIAVKADGSGEVVWRNDVQSYVPSLLAHDGFLYAVIDKGIAYCWDARTGEEKWKHRLSGTFNASPVLAGGNIYAAREDGTTFVFKASPERFELVAENQLGQEVFATPAFVNNRIYARIAEIKDGQRQEWLCCIQHLAGGGK
jgi:outer membrane protein assembly factor BamB